MLDTDKDKIITWHDELRDDFLEVYESDFMDGCINGILIGLIVCIIAIGIIVAGIAISYR